MNQAKPIHNALTKLLNINYPLIQAGMVWVSGWRLASAVSNAGGLGVIGSGSMYPQVLEQHIVKCKSATSKPFAVNLPLLYPNIAEHISTIIQHKVPIVITSAGSPKLYTQRLTNEGIIVVHVVSSTAFAQKSEAAGCHAVIAEGFEAGGHNGREETTTLCLIPSVAQAVSIPVIAAGGIYNARSMLACMVLGASGVQLGSRFVATPEASCHPNFKQAVLTAGEGSTQLSLKELTPVRLLKNDFYNQVQQLYASNATPQQLAELLGKGRAKLGMYNGDISEGELEIGQISSMINKEMPAKEIVHEIMNEYEKLSSRAFAEW